MQSHFSCSLSPLVRLGFIWIICLSYCPIPAEAVVGEDENLHTTPVIKACGESVLASLRVTNLWHDVHDKSEVKRADNLWQVPRDWVSANVTTMLKLIVGEPQCRGSANHQTLDLADDRDNGNDSVVAHFYPNGYFRVENHIYAPDEYCIESLYELKFLQFQKVQLRVCKPDCGVGRRRPCIKKCCPLDEIFATASPTKCSSPSKGSIPFMPALFDDLYTMSEKIDSISSQQTATLMPHFIINYPKSFRSNCVGGIVLPLPSSKRAANILSEKMDKRGTKVLHSSLFRVRTDGAIMYKSLENKCDTMSATLDTFCVDGLAIPGRPFNNSEDEYVIFQCQVAEKNANLDKYLSFTFGVLLVTLSIFPLITSVVYTLLWKKQNVHGWSIAATSGSLFFMYIFQGTAHLIGVTLKEKALNTFYCRLLGVVVHFFMMSTFTWCSVMTFDLFITFRSVVPMNQRLQGVSRYLKYSAFGWGVPVLVVVVGILMDFVIYTANDCSYHAVPAYGQHSCGIVESSLGEYLYYPAGFLLCVNILLFTATCVKLCMYGRGATARARKGNDGFGECFSRFSKLFCVMGISWIFEILSWYVDGLGFVWYWNIFDIFNILRAVAVFAIYVCKSDVIKQLNDSYPALQRIQRPFGRLFTRKCSDGISVESTVVTGISTSPAIALKAVNTTATCTNIRRNGKKDGGTCDL